MSEKTYHREFNASPSLQKIAAHIESHQEVLDLGCGPGILGAYLKNEKNCHVDGIEYDSASCHEAKQHLDTVWQGDLEDKTWEENLEHLYDVIVLADVLEHLRHPEQLLEACKKHLKPQGKILISLPNAAYHGALLSLLGDRWCYGTEGIMDNTHLHFYTLSSFLELLKNSGLHGQVLDRVQKSLHDSEFSREYADALPQALQAAILSAPEAMSYQFIIAAQLGAGDFSVPIAPAFHNQFISQCFWSANRHFDPQHSAYTRGSICSGEQKLCFELPEAISLRYLRFDFTERPAHLLWQGLRIRDAEGCILYQHDCLDDECLLEARQSCALLRRDGIELFQLTTDPSLIWALPDTLEIPAHSCLQIRLQWLDSSQILPLIGRVVALQDYQDLNQEYRHAHAAALAKEQQFERQQSYMQEVIDRKDQELQQQHEAYTALSTQAAQDLQTALAGQDNLRALIARMEATRTWQWRERLLRYRQKFLKH